MSEQIAEASVVNFAAEVADHLMQANQVLGDWSLLRIEDAGIRMPLDEAKID
jgi:hypothetical protein